MPKVSILIPAYNAMSYLPETLTTVFRQTYTDYDILIVNDGSTDHLIDWTQQLNDPRIRLITQENQGLAGARNTGLSLIQSEYVALLDADDLWEPTKLEKQVQILETQSQVGLVYTWMVLANDQGKSTGHVIRSDPKDDPWRQLIEFNIVGCGSTPLIRRSCFETVGSFATDVSGADDWDMWFRIARQFKFAVVKEPLVRYRQSASNMSRNYSLMLETSRTLIERAFRAAPTEHLYLRNHSYGATYTYLGWKALESRSLDQARQFAQQATRHKPQLYLSWRLWRLKLAIALMNRLGVQRYETLLETIRTLRGQRFKVKNQNSALV